MTPGGRRHALTLIGGLLAGLAEAQSPQPAAKVARVGYLTFGSSDSPQWLVASIQAKLRELGWTEGTNIVSEFRYAEGQVERLEALAGDLVRRKVDVIVALQTVSAHAARKASRGIPVVFATSDAQGLVANLARPEGNLTGVTIIVSAIAGKQLQLLKELVPQTSRATVLVNPDNPSTAAYVREAEAAAPPLGLRAYVVKARDAAEIDRAFGTPARAAGDALVVENDAVYFREMKRIVAFAATQRLPAVYGAREFCAAGGLLSYGANLKATYAQLAGYVDRILRGARPGELPVTQSAQFELVVNARTATALGIAVPPTLRLRAEVIE